MKYLLLIGKNIRRNLLRSLLTAAGTMVLVLVVTLVWSVLDFLQKATSEKNQNVKAIVTERWQIPSQMPFAYAATLGEGAPRDEGDYRVKPEDSMTWQFFGGTTAATPAERTRLNSLFAFALQPEALLNMMDGLDDLPRTDPKAAAELKQTVEKLKSNRKGIVLGKNRLEALEKKVGETIVLHGLNYKDIKLEFDIVGTFPVARYDESAAMNRDYLNNALEAYQRQNNKKHPLADKTLNLVWLRLPDSATFQKVAGQVTNSPSYSNPAVKCETSTSGIGAFLEAYRDLLWGMRWLLAPAIWVTLSLVISNAISISVRERRLEFAVLKVLGFRPGHILGLVLGEALFLGLGAGLLSAGLTWGLVNQWLGGIKFPIAFFPSFMIPDAALWWGPMVGGLAAFAGSVIPAWSARTVKVSDVFARVA